MSSQHTSAQFDDFAADALEVREAVISGGFTTETGPDGASYTGISKYETPQWHENIERLLGKRICPRMSFFRLNLSGEMPHSWVHSDDICATYASVLYLNTEEQCKGGTAFWYHEALKLDYLPSKKELAEKGIHADWFYGMMTREWKDLTYWRQKELIPMKWNRFITYPTCLFHSRYPFEGFGEGPEDGRLVWVCFFDIEGEHERSN